MKRKIPAYLFLKALGITDKKILRSIKEKEYIQKLIKKINNKDAIIAVSEKLINKKTKIL